MDELVKRLKESKGELLKIHRATGITYSTIRSIRDGATKHPRIDTFNKLKAHYERSGTQ